MSYFLEKVFPSLVGTLTGAVLAFAIKKFQDQEAEAERRKGAGLLALFTISQYLNYLLNLEEHLHEWRDPKRSELAWLGVPELWDFTALPEIRVAELAFLLNGEDPNLLGELVFAHQKVVNLAGTIQRRNEQKKRAKDTFEGTPGFKIASVDPDLSESALAAAAASMLHERLQYELLVSAGQVLGNSKEALAYCQTIGRKLERFMALTWPEDKFVKLPTNLPINP